MKDKVAMAMIIGASLTTYGPSTFDLTNPGITSLSPWKQSPFGVKTGNNKKSKDHRRCKKQAAVSRKRNRR